jgi:transcriptional regulator with XRE-family HTH domain
VTEDFGSTLRRYRLRAGLSQNALAKVVGINASYINRLESGEREAPTREVAHALARALGLASEEVDRLLFSAGHVPPSLQKLGPADSTVAAVTRLLTNDHLSPEARADFRAIVETIAIRWQCNTAAVAANGLAHPAGRNGRAVAPAPAGERGETPRPYALTAVGAAH